jgi:protein-S-isoprenylcysteine O-methyltransferase Ste14
MAVLLRALTYATLFVGLFLVAVPQRILAATGIVRPTHVGPTQAAGLLLVAVGAALVLWCVLTFALIGKGTPAVFDPPRKLVVAGPYRWVRNPMYIGGGLVVLGASLVYWSAALALYTLAFFVVVHLLVLLYEEPHLGGVFGAPYADYRRAVHRWIPTWRS